jgi:heparan-alpha-glucosaminide N-acetyltransferase
VSVAAETAPFAAQPSSSASKAPPRNLAIDAFRGIVMLLMMGEVLQLAKVSANFPGNWFWSILAFNQTHVEWAGCSLHDMIQPSFSFLVGVALPYSIASRLAKGAAFPKLFAHALWRSLVLVALGIFLRSMDSSQTNFTFEDTLTQIGLGYPILFLLGFRSQRWQWSAFGLIIFGYWLAWALYPTPGPHFDYASVGAPAAGWSHNFTGFAAHWNKNTGLGASLDRWFLNLLPRSAPFVANGGGYLTWSFIPTLGTMILGLLAGEWVRGNSPRIPMKKLVLVGLGCALAGVLLHVTGICPIVKRIWTPAWTLFSGGLCFLTLAALSWITEVKGFRRWTFPLVVVGMNSIAAYLIAHLFEEFIASSFRIHLGPNAFAFLGAGLEPLLHGIALLFAFWLILFWMYRRKLFLRV